MQLYVPAAAATQKMAHNNGGDVDITMSGVGTNQQGEQAHTASFGSANINNTNEGTGVPRLACLWPAAWFKEWPNTSHLHQLKLKTLARGQASRGGRCKASSGTASPGRLARRRRDQGRGTSQGARDASHDDRDQAGAGLCSVLVSSLVQRGQAQVRSTEASSKGYHFSATRPRPAERQDGGHRGAQDGVIASAFGNRRPTLVRITCTRCFPSKWPLLAPFPLNIWKRTRASI